MAQRKGHRLGFRQPGLHRLPSLLTRTPYKMGVALVLRAQVCDRIRAAVATAKVLCKPESDLQILANGGGFLSQMGTHQCISC